MTQEYTFKHTPEDLDSILARLFKEEEAFKKQSFRYRMKCFIRDHNYFDSWQWRAHPLHPRNVYKALKNAWFFRKVILNYRPWDFIYSLRIWEKTLEAQQLDFAQSCIVNRDKYIQDLYMARCLLKRIIEEKYDDKVIGEFSNHRVVLDLDAATKLEQQDLALFCELVKKHSAKWWT